MTLQPDAQTIVEQLLLAHHARGIRPTRGLNRAGYAMLRAAGLSTKRSRAINTMVHRIAKQWRRDKMDLSIEAVHAEAKRLLV